MKTEETALEAGKREGVLQNISGWLAFAAVCTSTENRIVYGKLELLALVPSNNLDVSVHATSV